MEETIFAAAERISTALWSHPEVSDREFRSAERLEEKAEEAGFRVLRGFDGLPTAFLAVWDSEGQEEAVLKQAAAYGNSAADAGETEKAAGGGEPSELSGAGKVAGGGELSELSGAGEAECTAGTAAAAADGTAREDHIPSVAFLAEYDALPGYGALSPDGSGNGHACGHNWIAAAAWAAAVTAKKAAEARRKADPDAKARIFLIGTPAEETWGGKIKMADDGAFSGLGIDAAFECHLSGVPKHCFENYMLAHVPLSFTFHGRASHAAAHPENGVNALDAVNLTFAGIACLRQHVLPDTKLHGMITEGGKACNIVPERAAMDYYVRAGKREYLENVVERVINCAKGAALMTGCTMEVKRDPYTYAEMKNNPVLAERAFEKLKRLGERLKQENALKREESPGQKKDRGQTETRAQESGGAFAGLSEEQKRALLSDTAALRTDSVFTAPSGDIGNVSCQVPAFYGVFSTAPVSGGADIHDAAYLPVTDSAYAHALLFQAAEVMAETAGDILTDAEFRSAVREAFYADFE